MRSLPELRSYLRGRGFRPAPVTEELVWDVLHSPRWTIWSVARATMSGRAYDYSFHYVRRAKDRLEALVRDGIASRVKSRRGRESYVLKEAANNG